MSLRTCAYFVSGTDTGVGKTVISAALTLGLNAFYWKPVQSGTKEVDGVDCEMVARLTGLSSERIFQSSYSFREPASPHLAARLEGAQIELDHLSSPSVRPLVIEGAGGLLVPLNDHHLMIDLIQKLGFPTILVARSTLGTINHTLLSLEALRSRSIPVAGVVLNGPLNPENRAAIEAHGKIPVLCEVPTLDALNAATLAGMGRKIVAALGDHS